MELEKMITKTELEKYLERLENDGRSQDTIKNYDFYLTRFIAYIETNNITTDNCVEILEDYKAQLLHDRNLAKSSIKTEIEVVKRFLHSIGFDCSSVKTPKIEEAAPKYLSTEEVKKLIKAPDGIHETRDKAIIYLLYSSGLRVGELTRLNIEDINLSDGSIQIKRGKGGKARPAFTDPITIELIKAMLDGRADDNPALFLSRTGGRLSIRSVQRIVKNAAAKSGLPGDKVTPHKLRHSFAVHHLQMEGGLNIKEIQQLLGHKSLDTTMIYTKISDNGLKQRYNDVHSRLISN
jgi:site-specific recombinase XerD